MKKIKKCKECKSKKWIGDIISGYYYCFEEYIKERPYEKEKEIFEFELKNLNEIPKWCPKWNIQINI